MHKDGDELARPDEQAAEDGLPSGSLSAAPAARPAAARLSAAQWKHSAGVVGVPGLPTNGDALRLSRLSADRQGTRMGADCLRLLYGGAAAATTCKSCCPASMAACTASASASSGSQVRQVQAQCTPSLSPPLRRSLAPTWPSANIQVVVERFNYEINVRVLIAVRGVLFRLESLHRLDKTQHAHVGAIQFLATPLMQYGLDLLRLSWNNHKRRNLKGVPGSGGVPEQLRLSHPHPGAQMRMPPGFDGITEYERATGRPLRRVPQTAARRDRCFYARARARRRARGVLMTL